MKEFFNPKRYLRIIPSFGSTFSKKKIKEEERLIFIKKDKKAYCGFDFCRGRFVCLSYERQAKAERAGGLFRSLNKFYYG